MINVRYKLQEGWHVFSSDDLPGLYVASTCYRTALHDLPKAIKKLIQLDRDLPKAIKKLDRSA